MQTSSVFPSKTNRLTYFRSSHEGFLASVEGRMMKTSEQGYEKFSAREKNGIEAICGVTQLFIDGFENKIYGEVKGQRHIMRSDS